MSPRRRTQLIGVALIVGLAICSYAAFHPALPFSHGYRLRAIVASANQLQKGSPVRIAGVQVGSVTGIDPGPGNTTKLTMDLQQTALPLHRDATLRIRPRVFLEGGFYVELHPGSPSAPELASEGTLPLPQTAIPVQFHQFLTTFDQPTRASLRQGLHVLAGGLDDGGGESLAAVAPQLKPTLRDLSWVAQAAQGTAPHDVSRLIGGAAR
ncbi:MAG TPA: MlaD family protein, partial [Solirubrobacteraceae bacterium]